MLHKRLFSDFRRMAGLLLAGASIAGAIGIAGADAAPVPASATSATPVAGGPTTPPPIKHVWLVVLENKSYDEAFVDNSNTYLWDTLPRQGVLLRQYYGTGHLSNDNYISMLSGQGTNGENKLDCMYYDDMFPGTVTPQVAGAQGTAADVDADQALGQGCVYPAATQTLVNQLSSAGLSWKGYMQDMGQDPAREQSSCGLPLYNGAPVSPTDTAGVPNTTTQKDDSQSAEAADQYAARHNPFIYFHSITDDMAGCQAHVVPLADTAKTTGLKTDLASESTTPNFSMVVPNLCNDAHDAPCAATGADGTKNGGLVAADAWLSQYVPMITGSPAFKDDGMLIVTFDESDVATTNPTDQALESASCCQEPASPDAALNGLDGNGGGQVGAVVVSRYTLPNTVSDIGYNHFSMLRSLEDVFGITTGGTDGKGHLGFAAMPTGSYANVTSACLPSTTTPSTTTPSTTTAPTTTAVTVPVTLPTVGATTTAATTTTAQTCVPASETSAFVPFGSDVYSNPSGAPVTSPNQTVAESPWAAAIPVLGLIGAGLLLRRRRPAARSGAGGAR